MTEAALVANPNFVDGFVLARHHALDDLRAARRRFAPGAEREIATNRAVRTNGSGRSHLPRARAEAEVFRGQRADRANISRVAGKLGVKAGIGERDDLQ